VGRSIGALVTTLYRATRPRDLDHYEFFGGYHWALYRAVEPITVAPYSSRCRDRAFGPVATAMLRNGTEIGGNRVTEQWATEQRLTGQLYFSNASLMARMRYKAEVAAIPIIFEARASRQAAARRPPSQLAQHDAESELDRWKDLAQRHPGNNALVYYESGYLVVPTRAVVLGDARHATLGLEQAYENCPQTLRDVEETTRFRG
jgi:hypothetical protein